MIAAHKNVRILLSLLKQNNIRHIVISPGSRNIPLVKSVEDDPFFTCYSVVDERSAAYFAVGLTLEVRNPVVITSTSGQATRNYIPGMTEAYYRKAPVLTVTTDYDDNYTGQMNMQSVRQMTMPADATNLSVDVPIIKDKLDEHLATRRINQALDSLKSRGGGPAHINLRINEHWVAGDDILETARTITRHMPLDTEWPVIGGKRVLVLVGQHHPFSQKEVDAMEAFARSHDAVFYVNHISNYHGYKSVHGNLLLTSGGCEELLPDLVITIGGHLGDYPVDGYLKRSGVEHWRVSEDGLYADSYNSMTRIFECPESYFFERMATPAPMDTSPYLDAWENAISECVMPEDFVLSHALVAKHLSPLIPDNANLHFGILSSLRFWEFYQLNPSIRSYSNVAGFGIDGDVSTFLGQTVASSRMNFLIVGDLAFFYDMNSIGIRHIGKNVRILLVNNGGGGEFRVKTHSANKFGDSSNRHIAAGGHFGGSAEGWVRNNNFDYLSVRSIDQLSSAIQEFLKDSERPVLMEVFTTMADDSECLQMIIEANDRTPQSEKLKQAIKANIPVGLKSGIKKLIGR
jgi:2-succinyl-5-enolpyruvyl-6-hydroxy-3-cyclohexene-1-carboxylate synthase